MGLFGPPNIEKLKAKNEVAGLIIALAAIGDTRAVEPLIAALKDTWGGTADAALEALGRIGDPRAVEPLITMLGYDNEWTRRKAIKALVQISDASAVEPLIAMLDDQNEYVRQDAMEALAKIGIPAVTPLIAALKDRNLFFHSAAAEALDKIGWQPDEGADGAAYWIAKKDWDRCVQIGAPAVKPLTAALKKRKLIRGRYEKSDWYTRKFAAKSLVALYQSGQLDDKHQRLILKQRQKIGQRHKDREYWNPNSSDCYDGHEDTGIGVKFPV